MVQNLHVMVHFVNHRVLYFTTKCANFVKLHNINKGPGSKVNKAFAFHLNTPVVVEIINHLTVATT